MSQQRRNLAKFKSYGAQKHQRHALGRWFDPTQPSGLKSPVREMKDMTQEEIDEIYRRNQIAHD